MLTEWEPRLQPEGLPSRGEHELQRERGILGAAFLDPNPGAEIANTVCPIERERVFGHLTVHLIFQFEKLAGLPDSGDRSPAARLIPPQRLLHNACTGIRICLIVPSSHSSRLRKNYIGTRDWRDGRGFEVQSSRFRALRTSNF